MRPTPEIIPRVTEFLNSVRTLPIAITDWAIRILSESPSLAGLKPVPSIFMMAISNNGSRANTDPTYSLLVLVITV